MQLPQLNATPADIQTLSERIDGEVRTSRHERLLYATDASPYQVEPLAVVQPRHAADIQEIVRWCAEHGLPVLPRGGGTSLAGQTVNRAVVVDCSVHMHACTINATNRMATVEPGVILDQLRAAAAEHGLTFGAEVSTSAQATLGGMVANNSAGLHSLWWGMTGDHVRAVDIVLGDGTAMRLERGASEHDADVVALTRRVVEAIGDAAEIIEARFPRVLRNNGGYRVDLLQEQIVASTAGTNDAIDLARLLCGSEGTLAFVTGIEVDLVEQPNHVALAVLGFESVSAAMQAVVPVLSIDPSAVELLDDDVISKARAHTTYCTLVDLLPKVRGGDPSAVLFVDCFADDQAALDGKLAALRSVLSDAVMVEARASAEQAALWDLRKVGLGLISGGWSDRHPIPGIEDCAVPVERLAEFQQAFTRMLDRHGVQATWYAHASVGLLHARPRLDLHAQADRDTFSAIGLDALALVQQCGGSISGEHGDGRIRAALVHAFYGPEIVDVFRRVKHAFDPEGRFNPGVLIDAPDLFDALRMDQQVDVDLPETFFHWREEGSFRRATEQCNGQGLCRRQSEGAMCPSYRATRDERHSTRGRGNALRLAITGQTQPGKATFNDADTIETLDLCLGCKACRYECPSQVDVAKLKAEHDAQRWRARGGAPWRVRVKAQVRRANRLGSRFHVLFNALQRFGPTAGVLKRVLGVHSDRTLPAFAPPLQHVSDQGPDAPVVLLYPDCFTMWNEPGNGRDAIRLLEAFGYRVVLAEADCCGRTCCSAGMLEQAIEQVQASAASIGQAMQANNVCAVVAVEPSCATSLQQEWLELRTSTDVELLERIAGAAHTVESFLIEHWSTHPVRPEFQACPSPIMVHVHCHQKHRSQVVADLLAKCGCADVELLDSGCCGMAGSFGYDSAHYALSGRIAEQSLGEAMGRRGEAIVVAHGTSCRHQMNDVFGVQAVHPVSLLAGLLDGAAVC